MPTETTIQKPYWSPGVSDSPESYELNRLFGHQERLYYDRDGNPRPYLGPQQGLRGFDPNELYGYDQSRNLALGGAAGGYAQNYAGGLYNTMMPGAQQNLLGAMQGQYTTPIGQLQGADRTAMMNVQDILSGKRLHPDTNPQMQGVMDAISRQVMQQRDRSTRDMGAAFSSRGRAGGSDHRRSQLELEGQTDQAIADATSKALFNQYQTDSQTRDALTNQIMQGSVQNRMGTAGSLYNLGSQYDLNRQYSAADRLLNTGPFRRESITDPNLQTAFTNAQLGWDWQQGAPRSTAEMIAILQRGSGQRGTTVTPGMTPFQGATGAGAIAANLWGAY